MDRLAALHVGETNAVAADHSGRDLQLLNAADSVALTRSGGVADLLLEQIRPAVRHVRGDRRHRIFPRKAPDHDVDIPLHLQQVIRCEIKVLFAASEPRETSADRAPDRHRGDGADAKVPGDYSLLTRYG